jgi:hypothetical protein
VNLRELMLDMFRIAALRSLITNCGQLFMVNFFHLSAMKFMNFGLAGLISKHRTNLIWIIEAAGVREIKSSIGNKLGIIDEKLLPSGDRKEKSKEYRPRSNDDSDSFDSDPNDVTIVVSVSILNDEFF